MLISSCDVEISAIYAALTSKDQDNLHRASHVHASFCNLHPFFKVTGEFRTKLMNYIFLVLKVNRQECLLLFLILSLTFI